MRILKTNALLRLYNSYVVDSPQPANISYMWNFGVRPARLSGYLTLSPSYYIFLTVVIFTLLLYIPQYITEIEANNFFDRVADIQRIKKDMLPYLVVDFSGILYGEVNELVTYCCHLFQGQYLKQNISVLIELSVWQGPICQLLSENSTALQDSKLIITIMKCASTYKVLDFKRTKNATGGSNRLWYENITRGRRYHSSPVRETKDTSQNSVFKSSSNLEPNLALIETKPKIKKAVDNNAILIDLHNKIQEFKQNHQKIFNLSSIFTDPHYLISCYNQIKGKPGNMSPGINNETLDGIDLNWFYNIASDLKSGKFKFTPTRQVLIPKSIPGKLRPLAIGSPREKIVQKALERILSAIWEPKFSSRSHGFRPGKSVHTALLPLYLVGRNYSWVIQGDIKNCFDMIPHKTIMDRLSKQIGDQKFLVLIQKFLTAGVKLESGIISKKDKGVPQGGILSPILANIVLDEFDKFVEKTKQNFEKGKKRSSNPEYNSIRHLRNKAKTLIERRQYLAKLRTIPIGNPLDPNFKRLEYIRYADDFVILIEGNKNDAINVKNIAREFLFAHCGLTLNPDKTIISNLSDNNFSFLGAEIHKLKKESTHLIRTRNTYGTIRRRPHTRLLIKAPLEKILLELKKNKYIRKNSQYKYVAMAYTKITNLSHYEIITFFNSKINGLLNFYSFASNLNRLRYVIYLFQMSCAYTLARKYKLNNFTKAFSEFGKKLTCPKTGLGLCLPDTMKVKHKFNKNSTLEFTDMVKQTWSAKLTEDTFDKSCALCGTTYKIEMHHLRSVKNIRTRMRTGNSTYDKWIGATVRKQIPLCKYHHNLYHSGQLTATDLREISKYSK
jgi:group II intron reverse transcriptase/maturase